MQEGPSSGVKLSWPKIVIQCAGMNRHAAERGDFHYGKDFIELQRHCEGKSCVCVADFKVISSTENAKEFADYVTSLEQGRVRVVYDLVLSEEGRFVGARLLRVGDWTSDRSHHGDGLLGLQVTFKAKRGSGRTVSSDLVQSDFLSFFRMWRRGRRLEKKGSFRFSVRSAVKHGGKLRGLRLVRQV